MNDTHDIEKLPHIYNEQNLTNCYKIALESSTYKNSIIKFNYNDAVMRVIAIFVQITDEFEYTIS